MTSSINHAGGAGGGGVFEWRPNPVQEDDDVDDPSQGWLFTTSPRATVAAAEASAAAGGVSGGHPNTLHHHHELVPMSLSSPNTTTTTTNVVTSVDESTKISAGLGDDTSPPNAVDAKLVNGITIPISASAGWSHHAPQNKVYPSNMEYIIQIDDNDSLEMKVVLEYNNPYFTNTATIKESMMVNVAIAKTTVFGDLINNTNEENHDGSVDEEDIAKLQLVSTKFQELVWNSKNPRTTTPFQRVDQPSLSPPQEEWMDITADVDYETTAKQVVEAVLSDPNCGQTAGIASTTADQVNVTLGPFSKCGRIILTYKVEQLYSYQAMSTHSTGADIGTQRLCPLVVALPHAPLDDDAGLTPITVHVSAPSDTDVLSIKGHQDAYIHLKKQKGYLQSTTLIAITDLVPTAHDEQGRMGYTFQMNSLPPRSCGLLSWFVMSNKKKKNGCSSVDEEDFVDIGRELEQLRLLRNQQQDPTNGNGNHNKDGLQVVIQQPSVQDLSSLQVPLPGHGPMGQLLRLQIATPKAKRRTTPCFLLNLTLSDKSGSTGIPATLTTPTTTPFGGGRQPFGGRMVATTTTTMRDKFNDLAVTRFLKRLESIPTLVQAGVLLPDDVWMDVFLPFDSTAPASNILRVSFRIADVMHSIETVVQTIRAKDDTRYNKNNTTTTLNFQSSITTTVALPFIQEHVDAIRAVVPGGATDFTVGPNTIVKAYQQWEQEVQTLSPAILKDEDSARCTFVEFDTDGGHNSYHGSYVDAIRNLCAVCHVRSGVVTGFGSWLNQHCATKVANALGGSIPAQLALHVPEPGTEGLDLIFRRSFAAWIHGLRQPPAMTLKLSAGSVTFPTSSPTRTRPANAMEVLAVRRHNKSTRKEQQSSSGEKRPNLPRFGPPDVSNEQFTATVLKDVQASDHLLVYIVSRLEDVAQLAKTLEVVPISTDTNVGNVGGGDANRQGRASVSTQKEQSVTEFLCYDWLTMLTSRKGRYELAPLLLKTSLRSRLEEELSFRFNIPSPSGMTSYLGRCKTVANRAPIDADHRPSPPTPPLVIKTKTAGLDEESPLPSELATGSRTYDSLIQSPLASEMNYATWASTSSNSSHSSIYWATLDSIASFCLVRSINFPTSVPTDIICVSTTSGGFGLAITPQRHVRL